jgi:hypothetical protein
VTVTVSCGGIGANLAETLVDEVVEIVQEGLVPLQAPPQPAKMLPLLGEAVRVTLVVWTFALHVDPPVPQVMPAPVTVPDPDTDTDSVTTPLKLAVTLFAAFIVTVHVVAVPPHAPVQPMNVPPVAGVATRVTVALAAKFAEHTLPPLPQLIAPVPPVTLPEPLTVTERGMACVKVAVTVWDPDIVTVHVPDPLQSPVQPVNV